MSGINTKISYQRKWCAANREKKRAYGRAWAAANPDKVKARNRRWRTNNLAKARAKDRKRHGIPEPTHPAPERCECCGNLPGQRALAADHCRVTGVFRGWLCFKCNTGLGLLGDTLERLHRCVTYLEKSWQR